MLNFKSENKSHQQASHSPQSQQLLNLNTSSEVKNVPSQPQPDQPLNPYLKHFLDASSSRPNHMRKFPLLKLNYDRTQQQQEQTTKPSANISQYQHTPQKLDNDKTLDEKSKQPMKSVGVEAEKPMYDGYILSPDAVKDMLHDHDDQTAPFQTSADAHYKATKHLRDKPKKLTDTKFTMTDISSAPVPAPDVLLNLKFDVDKDSDDRDFVNVVDLEPEAVEHILKLIEHEQANRRPRSPRKEATEQQQQNNNVPSKGGDELTQKLLEFKRTADEYKEYDEVMAQQIAEQTERVKSDVAKQRAVDDIRFIDEKIRAMNRMADEMTNDYGKFGRLADKLSDLVEQREVAEKLAETDDGTKHDKKADSKKKIKPKPKPERDIKIIPLVFLIKSN